MEALGIYIYIIYVRGWLRVNSFKRERERKRDYAEVPLYVAVK